MNRREFMVMGAAGAALAGMSVRGDGKVVKLDAPPRNRRPYAGLDHVARARADPVVGGSVPKARFRTPDALQLLSERAVVAAFQDDRELLAAPP